MPSNSKTIPETPKYRYILAFGSNLEKKKKSNCEKGLRLILKQEKLVKISNYLTTEPPYLRYLF